MNSITAKTINHSVLLVGYTEKSWIIKESVGTNWGDKGYVYVSRDTGKSCGIGYSYVTVTSNDLSRVVWGTLIHLAHDLRFTVFWQTFINALNLYPRFYEFSSTLFLVNCHCFYSHYSERKVGIGLLSWNFSLLSIKT